MFTEAFFRDMAFPERDPNYDLARFDSDKDAARLAWIRQPMDATDTDLSRSQSRGGKIIMYHGWADPALNPRMSLEYYDKPEGTVVSGFSLKGRLSGVKRQITRTLAKS